MNQFVSWLLTFLGGNIAELAQREDYEALRRAAIGRLKVLPTVLLFIDNEGYTADGVRALLEHHYTRISNAPIGSVESDTWLDVRRGAEALPPEEYHAAQMLAAGYSVTEIGKILRVNGSRLVMASCKHIARYLEAK